MHVFSMRLKIFFVNIFDYFYSLYFFLEIKEFILAALYLCMPHGSCVSASFIYFCAAIGPGEAGWHDIFISELIKMA